MTIWFGDNSVGSVALIKDLLNRVVPSEADKIYIKSIIKAVKK